MRAYYHSTPERKAKQDGRSKQWASDNREASRAIKTKWREANREREAAQTKEYRERPENRENYLRWKRANEANRRARKLNQFIESVDADVLFEMHGGMCGICQEFISDDNWEIDHRIPLSRGGMHGYVNCQPSHQACNRRKHAQLPELAVI
jgi:5-methylcytosine-specific restriction endonuclease McrA